MYIKGASHSPILTVPIHFFLEVLMSAKTHLIQSIVIFAALAVAGIALLVFGVTVAPGEASVVLPLIGAAMFSSALTFFLIRMAGLYA
jgi:hypothetical protein